MSAAGFFHDMRRFLALPIAIAALAAAPAVAPGSRTQESTFQDDNLVVFNSPQGATQALARMKGLGADRVRVSLFWRVVAPAAASQERPAFDSSDPAAYPPGLWDRYDHIVRVSHAMGLKLNLNITSPAPSWATGNPARPEIEQTYSPDPNEFKNFVRAAGRRYSGTYVPGPGLPALPRVDYWSIWNEPNQGGWLTPQWVPDPRNQTLFVDAAPHLYRALLDGAYSALQETGHGNDTILVGETAPKGASDRGESRSIDAVRFIKQMYCLDDNLQFFQGPSAQARFCPTQDQKGLFPTQHPGLFRMTGFAHHPYELTFAPDRPPPFRDRWITIGNIGDLNRLLRRIFARYGQPIPGNKRYVPLYLTEFGYQTKPPDPLGVSFARQSAYLNQSEYMTWRNPVVRTLAQFLLVDDSPIPGIPTSRAAAWARFQSGLVTLGGRHKPSYDAYRVPIHIRRRSIRRGQKVGIWGQVRAAQNGAPLRVQVQQRPTGGKSRRYRRLKTVTTRSGRGYVTTSVQLRRSTLLRLAWRGPNRRTLYSRGVSVRVR
jgi:hypothetical protein